MRPRWLFVGILVAGGCAGHALDPVQLQPVTQGDSALRPGDALRVTVWRQPEFSGEFVINPDSTVAHPLLQAVRVGGVSVSVARARLRDFLSGYEQNPRFVVEPLYPVVVAGEVRAPGLLTMPRGTTLSQAIARAGGPTDRGRLDRVKLVRGGKAYTFNLLGPDQRIATTPVMSSDQLLVARRSDFNVVRDLLAPLASLSAAVAAVIAVTRR